MPKVTTGHFIQQVKFQKNEMDTMGIITHEYNRAHSIHWSLSFPVISKLCKSSSAMRKYPNTLGSNKTGVLHPNIAWFLPKAVWDEHKVDMFVKRP